MKIPKDQWAWYGNAGHFICGYMCRFHLTTLIGEHLVSTVGQMWTSRSSREIHADIYDKPWFEANKHLLGDNFDAAYMKRFGFEEVGAGRTFETMVFKAGKPCDAEGCACGLPSLSPAQELDFAGANTAGEATANHNRLCEKWADPVAAQAEEAPRA